MVVAGAVPGPVPTRHLAMYYLKMLFLFNTSKYKFRIVEGVICILLQLIIISRVVKNIGPGRTSIRGETNNNRAQARNPVPGYAETTITISRDA